MLSGGIFAVDLSLPLSVAGGVPYVSSSVRSATMFLPVPVAPSSAQFPSNQTSPRNISERRENELLSDRYDWQAWTTQDGLPQNSVSAIVQTRDGYLWLGTFGGLARFDGVRFKIFDISNTEALASNRILSLLEDRSGNLWIGTQGGGVVRLHDGVFTSFHDGANAPRGEVWSIVEDRDGIVWFGGRNLVRYADGRFEAAGPDEWMTRYRQIWSLFVDREQSLWVATSDGLGRFRDGRWRVFQAADGLPFSDVRFVHEDPRGLLWASTIDRFCYFDGDRFVESLVQGERPSWIFAAAVDGGGSYWVGSGNGLFHARPIRQEGDDSSERTLFQRAIERSVAGRVRALLEDREGNIWVGTDGDGLLRIRAAAFKPITPPSGFDAGSAVRSLAGDGSGGLWIHFGGRNIVHVQDDEWKKLPANDDIGQIHSIKSGGDGTLWIRHGRKRLSKFRDGHFTHLEQELNHLRGFFVDLNGTVWIFSAGRLSMVRDGQTKPIVVGEGMPTGGGGPVTDSRNGTIWIGGDGTLIGYRDGESRRYTIADGMPRGQVRSIHEGSDGNLWIATYGGGMARLHNDTLTRYTTLEGLPDNSLGKILEDDAGNLWINSNRGVFRVSLDELNGFADGRLSRINCRALMTSEARGQFGVRTADGRLWFPTLDGLITIEPKLVTTNEVPPPIVIETVRGSDQSFDAADRIELPLGRRDVVIEYAGLSFADPDNVTFKYRLIGYEEDWVDAGARRRAEYRHIPPGTYEFQVQASNNDHVWSEHAATLGVTLPAHFYETTAFYVACWLGVVLAGFVGLRARTRTMRIRNAAVRESEAKYSDLYDNAPDMHASVDAQSARILQCNETLARRLGYSRTDIIGRLIFDLYHPDSKEEAKEAFQSFVETGEVNNAELQLACSDGSPIDVSLSVSSVRDANGKILHGRSCWRDVTERREADKQIQANNAVLEGVTRLQGEFLVEVDPRQSFDKMLALLLEVTASEYGFIGEILCQPGGEPYLKTHAITNIAWNDETRAFYEQNAPTGLEFYNLNTLFGAVITTRAPVLANDAAHDPRKGGLPPGHPTLHAFMGLPFFHGDELNGMVGLANRVGGYDEEILETLTPILTTCSSLVHAYHLESQRKRAEEALLKTHSYLKLLKTTAVASNEAIDVDSAIQTVLEEVCACTGWPMGAAHVRRRRWRRSSGIHAILALG